MRYSLTMKSSQLPPVRVEPAIRAEIEASLRDGESLSKFVEAAALQAARRRQAQDAFIARGQASILKAKRTGELYSVDEALANMRASLQKQLPSPRSSQKAVGKKQ